MVKDRLVVFVEGVDADVRGARIIVLIERSDTGLALVLDILAILQQRLGLSNAITSVASGLAALMAVALRFLSCYSATVRVT